MTRLLLALLCLACAAPAHADFVSVGAFDEASILFSGPNQDTEFTPGPLAELDATFLPSFYRESAVLFDLRSFRDRGAVITRALLTLHAIDTVSNNILFGPELLFEGLANTTGVLDLSSFPPIGGPATPIADVHVLPANAGGNPIDVPVTIDVTAFLSSRAAAGADYAAILFRVAGQLDDTVTFAGSLGPESRRPTLAVTFAVPEPGSLLLMGIGLLPLRRKISG